MNRVSDQVTLLFILFGKKITEKCKIVASSEIGMHLCKKMLKSIGINEYINNIIDIGDVNGDGKYDIKDFLDMSNEDILKMNNGKKFDICLMNPPYDNGLGNNFLNKVIDISNKIITIQPLAFILGKKQVKKIVNKLNDCYVNIENINSLKYFDAGYLNGEQGIIQIDFNKNKKILYNNVEVDDITNIKRYSDDKLIVEFKNIVEPLYKNDNIQNHLIKNYNLSDDEKKKYYNKYIIRLSLIVREYKIFSADTKIGKYSDIYKLKTNKQGTPGETNYLKLFISFDNKNEMKNCFNYLHTDFVNTCMYLIKTTLHIDNGELKCIPWFDFSDIHFSKSPKEIDDWLFKKYNISNDIRKHIEEILPDYYKIRYKRFFRYE